MKFFEDQPAYKMYVFDGGWYVIQYVFQNVFRNTGDEAKPWFDRARRFRDEANFNHKWDFMGTLLKVWKSGIALGNMLGGASHYITAILIVALFSVIQFVILAIGALFASVGMVGLTIFNRIYTTFYRIYVRCPVCHNQFDIPIYICSKCGERHSRLWPSVYGVVQHRCKGTAGGVRCDTPLPTLNIMGRSKLVRRCPVCDNELHGQGTNVHIPIIGGPHTGKSHYIVAATQRLIDTYAPDNSYTTSFPDPLHEKDYENSIQALERGERLAKTSDADASARAYNIEIRRSGKRVPKLLYIYDLAGEFLQSTARALQQEYFKYIDGIVLIIDPFSIDSVQREYKDQIKASEMELAPGTDRPDDIFQRTVDALEAFARSDKSGIQFSRHQLFPHPVAVVLTKVDAFDLEKRIGGPAARALMAKDASFHYPEDAISYLVEQFLNENGAGNFVRSMRAQFTDVKFFSCSALGRMADRSNNSRFEGVRVLEPILWLMGHANTLPVVADRASDVDLYDRTWRDRLASLPRKWRYYFWDSLKPIDYDDRHS